MRKLAFIMTVLFWGFNAFAHEAFVGTLKGSGEPCTLEIEEIYFENQIETPENFRAVVAVGLHEEEEFNKDDHEHELLFVLKPSGKPNILSGVGDNQKDLLNVLVANGSMGLEAPVSFAIKWLHGNHYHTAQCLNLVPAHE